MGVAVAVVKQMTQMTSGKAYFATPNNLSQFVLLDFLRRKKVVFGKPRSCGLRALGSVVKLEACA